MNAFPVVDVMQRPINVGNYVLYRPGGGHSIRFGRVNEIVEKPIMARAGQLVVNYQYFFKTLSVDLSTLSNTWSQALAPAGTDFTWHKQYYKAVNSRWEAGSAGPDCGYTNQNQAVAAGVTICTDPDLISAFVAWTA